MKDAMIVTRDYHYYPMTKFEANWYLVEHGIEKFECRTVRGVTYFYCK